MNAAIKVELVNRTDTRHGRRQRTLLRGTSSFGTIRRVFTRDSGTGLARGPRRVSESAGSGINNTNSPVRKTRGSPARRVGAVANRRREGPDHRGSGNRHLPRRHPLRRRLPGGRHLARPPRLARPCADRPVPRALGTRGRLPRAAAHPARRPGAALAATRSAWSRRCGHCWPSTRRCGSPSPTPWQTIPGTDPDRASYQIAVQTAQTLVTGAHGTITGGPADLTGDIGRAVLAHLHGPRRPRVWRPQGEVPAEPLEQAPRPASPAHAYGSPSFTTAINRDHQQGNRDTPTTVLDTDGRRLNSPALRLGSAKPITCDARRRPRRGGQERNNGARGKDSYVQHWSAWLMGGRSVESAACGPACAGRAPKAEAGADAGPAAPQAPP